MVHIRAVSILYWSTNRARWILTASTFSVMLLAVLLSVSTSTVEARETDPTERIPMEATDPAAEDPPALHPADAAAAWAGESWVQSAILTADDGVEDDRFGGAVAMDGEIIVVGAPTKNESRGAAYVFTRPAAGGEAVQVAKLVASDAKPSARFGVSVAVSGDTVVVGATGEHGSQTDPYEGAAYVFVRPESGWNGTITETAKLGASDFESTDYILYLGHSVAVDGDTIVVGATGYYNEYASGTVYLYEKPASGWVSTTESARFKPSDSRNLDTFGISVDISGDTVVVGTNSSFEPVSVGYIYQKPSSGWTSTNSETSRLMAGELDGGESSVAIDADTIVVGLGNPDRALVYARPAVGRVASLSAIATLTPSTDGSTTAFGESVDVDGETIVVGSPSYQNEAVYLYTRPQGGWVSATQTLSLTGSSAPQDSFGANVALAVDALVVGAPAQDQRQGAAYVYKMLPPSTATIDSSGGSVGSQDGSVRVAFPPGAVDEEVTVAVSTTITAPHPTEGYRFATRAFIVEAADGSGQAVTQFNNTFTLTVAYDDSNWQDAGIENESELNLYFWDGSAWQAILPCAGCSHDRTANRIVAVLDHLTDFTLMAENPQHDIYLPAVERSGPSS